MLKIWIYFLAIPKIKFLLLTNDDPHSHPLTIKEGKIFGERLIHRKLKREDVPLVLASCDIAFMLREDRPLNRSASPVKFPEYLAAGLAVVASPGIGDISNLIVDENLGVLVDPNDIVKSAFEIQNFLDDFELNGKEYFSSKAHKIAQEKFK